MKMMNKFVDDLRIERIIRSCILLLLGMTLFGVILIMLLHIYQNNTLVSCKTDTCKQINHELFRQLNANVSACADFGEHVCGKFDSLFTDNEQVYYTNTMRFILDCYKNNCNNMLETPLFVDAIGFYHACTNQEARNTEQFNGLFEIYNEIGGWPIIMNNQWNSHGFRYERSLINLYRKIKRNFFFDVEIKVDQRDEKVVHFKKYSQLFEGNKQNFTIYKSYIKEMVRLVYPGQDEIDEGQLDKQIDELIEFEHELNQISFDMSLSITLNMFNITYFETFMDWSLVISNIVDNVKKFYPEYNDLISIGRDSVRHINRLLRNEKTFANYLGWKITEHFSSFTTINMMKLKEKYFNSNLASLSSQIYNELDNEVATNLKQVCAKQTIQEFHLPIDFLFKKNLVDRGQKKFVDIFNRLILILERKLENSIWSDDYFTEKLSEKLRATNVENVLELISEPAFCYDNFLFSDSKQLLDFVVKIQSFNHLNELCVQVFRKEKSFSYEKRKLFDLEPQSYVLLSNVVETPNFWFISRFGTLIAKYLLKSIILSDESIQLMSIELRHLFQIKLNCYKDLVMGKNNEDSGMNLNSLVEQFILQSESLNLSYELFSKLLMYEINDQVIGNRVDHNLKQLFFISYESAFCHYYHSKTQQKQLYNDIVNFSIKNSPVFLDEFNCKQNSKVMRLSVQKPVDKCTLF